MVDRKKVVNVLEKAKTIIEQWIPLFEQYNTPSAIDDAIALLKEQMPVKPYQDYNGHDICRCGKCGATICNIYHTEVDEDSKNYAKFCIHCGSAIEWEST